MKIGRSVWLCAVIALSFSGLGSAPVEAQRAAVGGGAMQEAPARRNRAPAPDGEASGVPAGELVKMLDAYAVVQAQDALGLTDTQYGDFVTRLRRLQEARRRNLRERNLIIQDLRRLSRPQAQADETALRGRLQALRDHDERSAAEMRKAYETLDEVLDVRQQARFRAFEETIERRKLDLVVRARERAARARGGT